MSQKVFPCTGCEGGKLRRKQGSVFMMFGGMERNVTMMGWYCDKCGNSYHTKRDRKLAYQALDELMGPFTPAKDQ